MSRADGSPPTSVLRASLLRPLWGAPKKIIWRSSALKGRWDVSEVSQMSMSLMTACGFMMLLPESGGGRVVGTDLLDE